MVGTAGADGIVGVSAKAADCGKVEVCCEKMGGDIGYCPHTAFAVALPQVGTQ